MALGQNLEDILNSNPDDSTVTFFTEATFKSTRLINGRTIEMAAKRELVFCVSHRFGLINEGIRQFYGLDESSNIRFGFDYGITDRISVGIGRSRYELYDAMVQIKILQQKKGAQNFPFTLCFYSFVEVNAAKPQLPVDDFNIYRFSYTNQLLAASKITERLSLQVMPTFIHRNLVKTKLEKNDILALGFGGRFKITKRLALTTEYYYIFPKYLNDKYTYPLSVGLDLETGGHIFQIFVTNSTGVTEKSGIPQTEYSWRKGEVLFGFNISRVFAFNQNTNITKP